MELRLSPNPSRGAVGIGYASPNGGAVRIGVFDLRGRKIAGVVEADQTAGAHVAHWDGRDAAGRSVAPGAYLIRLEMAGKAITRKFALVR
jgi:flagellar hook assembly protein FlgD